MTREETIATLKANYPDACFEQLRDAVDTAISVLKQPEIIRCKDCKHHHRDNSGTYYCGRKDYGYGWGLNDFCSRSERQEG